MPAHATSAASSKASAATTSSSAKPVELTITRTFNAPRELVFTLFTEPEHVMKWGGPRNYVMKEFTQDVRVGGRWRGMLEPTDGGKNLWHGGKFLELDPPGHVSYTFAWDDDNGKPGNETVVTIDLEEVGSFTRLTFRQSGFPTERERDGHNGGWGEAFDKFVEFVATAAGAAPR